MLVHKTLRSVISLSVIETSSARTLGLPLALSRQESASQVKIILVLLKKEASAV